jgi:UDP-N-acetylmuramate dehydrogenase
LGVGGPAGDFVEVGDIASLAAALRAAEPGPVLVLGGGSNLVVADEGFPGTVVRNAIAGRRFADHGDSVVVSAGAGQAWSSLVEECISEGLRGIECLIGIPGLVGATPVQNVGAYGQEVAQTTLSVGVWDTERSEARLLLPEECKFSYRDSVLKRAKRYVVTEVSLRLERSALSCPVRYAELAAHLGIELGQSAPLEQTARAVLDLRRRKGMVLDSTDPDTRSAGSFFTNPVLGPAELGRLREVAPSVPSFASDWGSKVSAAWLVEHAGFARGYRRGRAAISTKHALALTVLEGGTAAELVALAREVRAGVKARFGVVLEPEPVLVGVDL